MGLEEFFDRDAVGVQTTDGFRMLTKIQLIRALAEQHGGAHEDWTHDEALRNAVQTQLFINGTQATMMELSNSARLVLRKGREVLAKAREVSTS
jgi:hypothetical protein